MLSMVVETDKPPSWEEKFISRFLAPALSAVSTLTLLLGTLYVPHIGA